MAVVVLLAAIVGNRSSPGTFVLGYKLSPTDVREVMTVADAFGATELPTVRITE